MTIIEAIKHVMRTADRPLTATEAFEGIVKGGLYKFHAQEPARVVLAQIRRHCVDLDFPSSAPTKHFRIVGDNRYVPLQKPLKVKKRRSRGRARERHKGSAESVRSSTLNSTLRAIDDLHNRYVSALKKKVLFELKKLSPEAFEAFSNSLMQVYGFEDMKVTQISGDGGIDGLGKLRVGLAHLNVAFQCKRWTRGNVQRTEIDKFRGAIQGDYEQGVFFVTTSFSSGAIGASIKKGAVPIVLIDGEMIVDLMISKGFGIETSSMTIPTYALDLALNSDSSPVNLDGAGE